MKRSVIFMFLILFCILGADTFSVQGVLRDPLGKTVEDGYYDLSFRIYDLDAGGTAIWEESHGSVLISNGVYGVELGSITSLDAVPFNENYWIGISVNDGNEMEPRMKMMKSPAAMSVFGTDNVFPSVGMVGVGTHEPEAYLHIMDSTSGTDKLRIEGEDGANDFVVTAESRVGVNIESPEADLHIKATDSSADKLLVENSDGSTQVVIKSDGKMGVNLEEPQQALDINGNLKMRNGGIMFDDGSTLVSADMGGSASSMSNFGSALITADSDEDGTGNLELISGSTTVFKITPDENIEITGNNIQITEGGYMDVAGGITTDGGIECDGSLSTGGSLTVSQGVAVTTHVLANEFQGTRMIDTDNSSYEVDPSGSSKLSGLSIGHTSSNSGNLDVRGDEVYIWDGSASVNYVSGAGDLFVEDILEVDNDIYVADGVNCHIMNSSGYSNAPYYADANNPSYLCDPSSTSKFTSLSLGHTAAPSGCNLDIRGNGVRIWDGTTAPSHADDTYDLYVQDCLEVRGRSELYGITYQNSSPFVCWTNYYDDNEDEGIHFQQVAAEVWRWGMNIADNKNLALHTGENTSNFNFVGQFIAWSGEYQSLWRNNRNSGMSETGFLDRVSLMEPVRYRYEGQSESSADNIGFRLEDVQEAFPEILNESEDGIFVNENGYGKIAVAAVRELNEKVDEQQKEIAELKKTVAALLQEMENLKK